MSLSERNDLAKDFCLSHVFVPINLYDRQRQREYVAYKFRQTRCLSLQKRLLPALESLETAFKFNSNLKDTLQQQFETHPDWAHIRENWYLREVLLGLPSKR